ncbi:MULTISPECIES: carbon-nitrogen hydrolase family protein [Micromonospora]|uniref:carbon-nitrogen hydrolase family protein n=1 Tax=Micromonospora TaxID=1873 RepID=UPI0003EEC108|nr:MULTISPECIES: carbon-nitrogen hydrolase family protein [unclassified Micromonospora]EWM68709.1 hydrolase, carbon-nitrogen family [Micromonospora sp. M42]MCK1805853.1 carbon-nitrogen hydrolase family protein [Micromonospora sp. R42106]MCK1831643.1 carbon-nitrogen hydrolase family protein [Micromonospora sp. R42003]MCK1846141.1 carbon-nitrogen hydrolase family protein [Micromonospora sp. R42004]MCM1020040.1 carbon-nitrogen hydrolase family protein [Micromonospora sp. XM-20-01]
MTALPARPLTVAAVQAQPVPGDVAGNARAAARLVARAEGARVVVLPELFLPAYHPPTLGADPEGTDVAADADGRVADPRLDPLRTAAADAGAAVVIGAAVRHPDRRRTISSLVVDPAGTVTAAYDKQQLWSGERELFDAGRRGATLEVDTWRLGLGVCYDGCFPEHARAAAGDGAHGYLCPSGYLAGSAHRRDLYYAARALDNTMYVVFANAVGGADPWRFNGGAAVYDPEGRPLARGADTGEDVLVATLDPDALAATRAAHTMLLDRPVDAGAARTALVA